MERWSVLVYDVHLTNLRHQIATLKDTFGWNPRSNFVIVIQTQKPKKLKQLLKEIVRQLWLSNIVNFVILISNSTHPVVTAYSWFPYNPTVLCGGVKTPVLLDKCIKDSEGNAYFLNNASLFPPKVPQDLHGCTITVSTFELEPTVMRHAINNEGYARGWMYEDGLELRLLKVLLEKINMSAVFRQAIPNPWGKIFKNGTWTGILGEVQRRESDVAFGGVIIDEWRWKAVDMTIPYIWDSMKWHVPCAKPMLRWMSLTMVFTPTLWVVFAIVYVAMSFFMWLLVKIHGWLRQKKSQYYSSLVKCFLYMWGVILGVSSPDEVPSSSTIRYVFFMWLVFCLAFNTVYQTYLTSFLIDPGLQHQLSSEDEILNSGLKFGYHTLFTLSQTSNNFREFEIRTWFPYHPPGRCADVRDSSLLDTWIENNESGGHFLNNITLFPKKIPRDMSGCPFLVSTFEYYPYMMKRKNTTVVDYEDGLDIRLIQLIRETYNMNLILRPPPPDGGRWGFLLDNGTWVGVTAEMMRGSSDLALVGWFYRCHIIDEIECSFPYLIDEARWYVPCAQPYPRWMSLTRVFKASLWAGFLAAYIVVALITWQVVKISNSISTTPVENQAYTSLIKCLFNFWAIILEESASNNPPHVGVIRAVFLIWVLYCWAVNTVYQTFLTSFLIDPGLQHQLSSEEEILNSGIAYGIPTTMVSILPGLSDSRYHRKLRCDEVEVCQHRLAIEGDLALFFTKYNNEYMVALKYMDGDGNPM
ncbi:hypothetical protein ANN_05731, partial [Periplaneta americana]